ncbi:3'-5' exonuclease [Methylobacterium sp. P31]
MNTSLDAMAAELEATGRYRVLRRLDPWTGHSETPSEPTFTGLIVDVETPGTDPAHDEVIELGMLKFEYGASGRIHRAIDTFSQFHRPCRPIPPEVTRLTGISDGDIAGHQIDDAAAQAFAADATLVIAHYATFDRPMCERRWPIFAQKDWACSCTQIPWRAEGHEGTKLSYLLLDYGYFYAGHRAISDCQAVLRLLAATLRVSGRLSLSCLLEAVRQSTVRIWAHGSPMEANALLKARRYRWSGAQRSWYVDLDDDQLEAELSYLDERVFRRTARNLSVSRITAADRFSARASPDIYVGKHLNPYTRP